MGSVPRGPFKVQVRLNKGIPSYEYQVAPDVDVFAWDDATMDAAEATRSSTVRYPLMRGKVRRDYIEDVETKKTLVKVRRVQVRLLARGDKESAVLLQEASLAEVRKAMSAKRQYDRRRDRVMIPLVTVLFLAPMLAPALVSLWVDSHRGWWLLLLGPTEWMIFLLLAITILDAIEGETPWRWPTIAGCLVLIACAAAAVIVGTRYRNTSPNLLLEFGAGVTVTGLLFSVSVILIGYLLTAFDYQGQGAQPEALLLVDLVSVIALAIEWEVEDSKRAALIQMLEDVATRAERAFPHAVSRSKLHLRQWSVDRGRRVAAVIRKHQERTLEVSTTQRGLITASLINGLVYFLRRDWPSLLVVEPEGEVKTLVRRYVPRLALTTFLIVIAFVLPALFPHVINDPVSFKATLLVTAGFTLIAPDVQKAADAVRSFGK
jgi:hypothetical protein